jgi:hypothetical protein
MVVGVGYASSPQTDVARVTAFCDRGRQKSYNHPLPKEIWVIKKKPLIDSLSQKLK